MSKRTPELWEARPYPFGDGWWVGTPDGSILVSMNHHNADGSYARRIATIPDMENALKAWLEWDGTITEGPSPPVMAKAALAKARGE